VTTNILCSATFFRKCDEIWYSWTGHRHTFRICFSRHHRFCKRASMLRIYALYLSCHIRSISANIFPTNCTIHNFDFPYFSGQ